VVLTQAGEVSAQVLGLGPGISAPRPVSATAAASSGPSSQPPEPESPELSPSQAITIGEMEKRMIFAALDRLGGNRTRAAEQLGISIRTLRNKLREYRGEPTGEDDDES
jgi:DNA-binding NtrC family response regulator